MEWRAAELSSVCFGGFWSTEPLLRITQPIHVVIHSAALAVSSCSSSKRMAEGGQVQRVLVVEDVRSTPNHLDSR